MDNDDVCGRCGKRFGMHFWPAYGGRCGQDIDGPRFEVAGAQVGIEEGLKNQEKATCAPQTTYGSMAGGRIRLQREGHINAPWMSEVREIPTSSIRPTMADEAEKQSGYHSDLATKAAQACMFFRANPAFEEFIRLIRSGAVQI